MLRIALRDDGVKFEEEARRCLLTDDGVAVCILPGVDTRLFLVLLAMDAGALPGVVGGRADDEALRRGVCFGTAGFRGVLPRANGVLELEEVAILRPGVCLRIEDVA